MPSDLYAALCEKRNCFTYPLRFRRAGEKVREDGARVRSSVNASSNGRILLGYTLLTFEVKRLVPSRIQRAPFDFRLQSVFLVRKQCNTDVRIGST